MDSKGNNLKQLANVIAQQCNTLKDIQREIGRVACELEMLLESLCLCRDFEIHGRTVEKITEQENRLKILHQNFAHMLKVNREAINEYNGFLRFN